MKLKYTNIIRKKFMHFTVLSTIGSFPKFGLNFESVLFPLDCAAWIFAKEFDGPYFMFWNDYARSNFKFPIKKYEHLPQDYYVEILHVAAYPTSIGQYAHLRPKSRFLRSIATVTAIAEMMMMPPMTLGTMIATLHRVLST